MRRFVVCCSALFAFAAFAGAKRPAEWTVEERLARRFNEAAIAERDQAYHAAHPGADDGYVKYLRPGEHVVTDDIDGARNPELFLPHELFTAVLHSATLEEPLRSKQFELYRPGIRHFFGNDDEFWLAMAALAMPLRGRAPRSDDYCRAAHMALESARGQFGGPRFDEFLYEVIAPTVQQGYTGTTSSDRIGELRRQASGCQQ